MTALSMESAQQIAAIVNQAVQPMKQDLAVHTEILERIETKQDYTNGSVNELQRWQIAMDAELKTRKEIRDTNASQYKAPVLTGLIVGAALLAFQLVLKLS